MVQSLEEDMYDGLILHHLLGELVHVWMVASTLGSQVITMSLFSAKLS